MDEVTTPKAIGQRERIAVRVAQHRRVLRAGGIVQRDTAQTVGKRAGIGLGAWLIDGRAGERSRFAIERQGKLRNESQTDDLTGLHNRRGFMTLADKQIGIARRNRNGFLLLFLDLDGLKRDFGKDLCLWGGVSNHDLVLSGPEEIRRQVKETIQACAPGGGFILGASHSITVGTPLENIVAMVEAAGRRPDIAAT